ncbi:PKD domain-containing protein [Aquipuribacter sp. SD81]|uniref:PKD domain-containing protein n=1 Tax=Aquipuribacter sp. SD81 TaxID=3127703 RepID=UPI003015A9BD
MAGTPSNQTPHVLDGEVYAVAVVGDVVVLGGRFTQARNFAEGSPVVARHNLLSFDRRTGELIPSFAPVLDDVVRTLAPAADGTSVYVGGQFGTIDGANRFKLARLDVRTGAPVRGFNPRIIDAAVMDVARNGNRLVVAGKFSRVGQDARQYLAMLDAETGAVMPDLDLPVSGAVWNGTPFVYKVDITPDGSRLVMIGNFRSVGGQTRVQVAQVDLTTSPATLTSWATNRFNIKCGSSSNTQFDVRDVDISPDGRYFVIGATGGHTASGALCDAVSRWEVDRSGSNQEPTWFNLTGGDSVYSVAATDAAVYAGGHMRWFNNPVYVQSYKGPGAVDREGIAALDPVNGVPLAWNPGRDRGQAVWDLVATPDGLYVASDTDRIARYLYRGRIAFFPTAGGAPVPQPRAPGLPVDVHLVSPSGSTDRLVRRSGFTGTTVQSAQQVAEAGTGWAGVRAAFVADGRLYSFMSNGVLTRRTVSAASYGAPETVELNGLTAFATDMQSATSAFYDEGRMYYTLSGSNALYMRYLSVESGIVGATRFQVVGGLSGLDWRNVRGAFLAGGSLYWAHGSTGALSRVTWGDRAPVNGTNTVVSSPASTGVDWRAQTLFARAAAPSPAVTAASECVGTRCSLHAEIAPVAGVEVATVTWTLGDGATATGTDVEHVYAPGSWTATVSVRSTDGMTASSTVAVAVSNAAPTAEATVSCAGMECTFDGSASGDPDGTVQAWTWDLGDGTSVTGATVTRTYATPGPRTVRLTVTDDRGATSVKDVVAEPARSGVAMVAVSSSPSTTTTRSWTVALPAGTQPGDTLLLFWSGNAAAGASAPAGWTAQGAATTAGSGTAVWSTVVQAGADSTVTVTSPTLMRADLVVAAYRGAAVVPGGAVVASETETVAGHVTPQVPVTVPGSWLVSYWADKSASTTSWAAPTGLVQRHQWAGSGSGHVSELLADSGGPVPVGTAGGLTAVADSAQRNATMASVVLAPAP